MLTKRPHSSSGASEKPSSSLRAKGIILSIVYSLISFTPEMATAQEVPQTFIPVRPLGMGGAFTAISNDENAIWTNPAGIARIRKARSRKGVHAFSVPFIAGANTDGRASATKIRSIKPVLDDTDEIAKAATDAANAAAASNLEGKAIWARAAFHPISIFELGKNSPAAFGLYGNNKAQLTIDASTETADVDLITDMGANFGFGFANRTNRLNFGFQVRPTYRFAYSDKVLLTTLVDSKAFATEVKENSNRGQAVALDFGGMFTLADFWYPTFAFAVFNAPTGCHENYLNPFDEVRHTVCGTKYSGDIKNPEALSVLDPTDIRIGLSITPRLSRGIGLRFALDAHHLYVNSGDRYYGLPGIEASKQLHAGMELFFGSPLKVNPTTFRVGYNQGFITFGASVRIAFLALEFASYGADISSSAAPKEDRRTLINLSFEI